MLERVLRRFFEAYADGVPELLRAASSECVPRWSELCHSLRGASAAIGAASLLRRLKEFELNLLEGAELHILEAIARGVHSDLSDMVGRLQAALRPAAETKIDGPE